MSLVTTCPSCGTVFRMVREQLDASGGWVRCGHCMDVFDARIQLGDVAPHDADTAGADAINPELSFVQTAQKKAFWSTPSMRLMLVMGLLLLTLLLVVQMIRFERDRLTRWLPSVSPVAQKLCYLWVCPEKTNRKIDAWLIEHSSFQKETTSHTEPAFRLNFQIKNTAAISLLMPHLELSLLDANEVLLVRGILALNHADTPSKPVIEMATSTVAAGEDRTFSFLVKSDTLATRITGYRLVLFHP